MGRKAATGFWMVLSGSLVLAGCRASAPVASKSLPPASSPSGSGPATPAFKVFAVYTKKGARHSHYSPSGYMGDSDLSMSGAYQKTPNGEGPCLRVTYKATGPRGWSGIFWQDPANNWGDVPGKAGYDLRGAERLTFWARGEKGGERIHEFRVGGIVGQYPDSDVATLSNVRLTRDWKQYTINLAKKDLRHIIAGFGFSVIKAENSGGMTFYLDDILYEGPASASAAQAAEKPAAIGQEPIENAVSLPAQAVKTSPVSPAPAPEPVVPPAAKGLHINSTENGLKVSFSSQLMFQSGQSGLQVSSHRMLDQLVALMNAYPSNRVLIEGHTDATGDPHLNLRLSELRAKSVRDYLIKQGGYPESRFQIVGYGDTKPIADNNTKAGRALNRRVEVTILKEVPR